jgi:release factor glutamine methyltransferase
MREMTDPFAASMPVNAGLSIAANMLASVSESPRLDAELLMAHALGIGRSGLLLRQRELAVPAGFAPLLDRRMQHEPVAYITGSQGFWDLELRVTPDVLIPRGDSETLIEAAIETFSGRPAPATILDLGTGSGALLLAALSRFPLAHGIGVDASLGALAVATDNRSSAVFFTRLADCGLGSGV